MHGKLAGRQQMDLMEKESDMKMPKTVFVGLGIATFAAALAVASVSGRLPSPTTQGGTIQDGATTHLAAAPTKSETGDGLGLDPMVSRIIEERQADAARLKAFRAAKDRGTVPEEILLERIGQTSNTRRGNGNLDQGGDDCASATAIPFTPYTDFGTTTGYADNYPECEGSGTGPDVVYFYTPPQTADFHVSLCGSAFDTKIAVYANNCAGAPIACNDDGACWPGSDIPRITLTGGIDYYFVIDGWNGDFGDYTFFLEELQPTPPGDDCSDPVLITSLPFSDNGVSSCSYSNDFTGTTCLSSQDEGPDVIYSFTLTTTTSVEIILTAYYAEPPNESWVMPGILLSDHCPPDWSCIASASSWTVTEYIPIVIPCTSLSPGTYWIMVDNGTWFHPCFTYDLLVQPCGPCDIVSQGGDVPEVAETFPLPGTFSINDPNGGCNNDDPFLPQYQSVNAGETVFGRTFAYTDSITGSTKVDFDWYRFVVTTPVALTCTYQGECELLAAFLDPPCPGLPRVYGIQTTPCGSRSFTTNCLGVGEYYVRISKGGAISGPDATPFDYRVTFDATPCTLPSGRCCYASTCAMLTEPECDDLFGYWDVGLTCETECPVYPPNDFCENAGVPAMLPATFTGNNVNATNDCPQEGDPQVWHVFTTTELSDIQIDYCGTLDFHSFNPNIYQGCPCDDRYVLEAVDWGFCSPITAMTGLWRDIPPGTYYISVVMYNPNSIGDYTIHVNAVTNLPPANDECATAEGITLVPNGSVTVDGTTMNATASCTDVCAEGGFNYSSSGGDVFYSLNLPYCHKIAMALGTSDMHLSVYQGTEMCCTSPAFLCNDDDENFAPLPEWDVPWQHPGGSQSYIAAELDAGLYIIRVAKYGGQVGYYNLTIYDNGPCSCIPPNPPEDLTLTANDDNIEIRWTTDPESATRGVYQLWSSTVFGTFDIQTWTLVENNIIPVAESAHLYYVAPTSGLTSQKLFYIVVGQCVEPPAR